MGEGGRLVRRVRGGERESLLMEMMRVEMVKMGMEIGSGNHGAVLLHGVVFQCA